MPSANKTPNYGLNQWQGNEYPKRTDFVEDNAIIDQKLKEIDGKASSAIQGATFGGEAVPKNDGVLDFPMPTAKQTGALPYNPSVMIDPDNMPDGIYYYGGHLEIPANTTGDGEIIQISHDQSFIIQIAYGFHLSGMAVRVKESGTWLAWSKVNVSQIIIPNTDPIPTGLAEGTVVLRYAP
ncbi:hypothetical protein FL966_05815 [Caproiciproducens galactitolivorans]|uniref:Uncharacterized protein n=1 Tax=Caproiciproducens galactitolivorans TaxID=642589 RepID=A0A4Z0Y8Z6_9FIRM|nr:pyocin knob domain-containing protein [Caproiciproducens galactitolivorans]QEY34607.1 hypothetical protein FL966_05815 [Caproiciproducens galactitolivorans]TGJ75430.1 hypothetical protein CAGA_24550 [Caproiciproducens galactitolivorans]